MTHDLQGIAHDVARGLHELRRAAGGERALVDGLPRPPWEELHPATRRALVDNALPLVQVVLDVVDAREQPAAGDDVAVIAPGARVPHPVAQAVDAAFGDGTSTQTMYVRALAGVLRITGAVSVSRSTLEEVAHGYVVQATPDAENGVVEFAAVPRP